MRQPIQPTAVASASVSTPVRTDRPSSALGLKRLLPRTPDVQHLSSSAPARLLPRLRAWRRSDVRALSGNRRKSSFCADRFGSSRQELYWYGWPFSYRRLQVPDAPARVNAPARGRVASSARNSFLCTAGHRFAIPSTRKFLGSSAAGSDRRSLAPRGRPGSTARYSPVVRDQDQKQSWLGCRYRESRRATGAARSTPGSRSTSAWTNHWREEN